MSATLAVIRKHYCATLKKDRWVCICGFDFNLPAESALSGPKQEEITDEWSRHLADKIIRSLNRQKILIHGSFEAGIRSIENAKRERGKGLR